MLVRVHAALAVVLDGCFVQCAVPDIQDERSGDEVDISDTAGGAPYVSGEYDSVGIHICVRDVHRAANEANAFADAGQAVGIREESVSEVLIKLCLAAVDDDR